VIVPVAKLLPPLGSVPPLVSPEPVVTMVTVLLSTVPLAGEPASCTGMRSVAAPPEGMLAIAQVVAAAPAPPVQLGAAGVKVPAVTVNTGVPASCRPAGSVSATCVISAACGPLLRTWISQSKAWPCATVASGVLVPLMTAALSTACTSAL